MVSVAIGPMDALCIHYESAPLGRQSVSVLLDTPYLSYETADFGNFFQSLLGGHREYAGNIVEQGTVHRVNALEGDMQTVAGRAQQPHQCVP